MRPFSTKLAMILAVVLYNTAVMPGIADNGSHAEFAISSHEVTRWKNLFAQYGF